MDEPLHVSQIQMYLLGRLDVVESNIRHAKQEW
jgi:hypothetical protein